MKNKILFGLILLFAVLIIMKVIGAKNGGSLFNGGSPLDWSGKESIDLSDVNDTKESPNNTVKESAKPIKLKTSTVSKFNTDNPEIENINRPEKTIIRNLAIDTTQAFGIWTQDPKSPHADFWLTSKSFYVVDYDGDGAMPYILDKNEITIFYNDFIQKGIITSTKNDKIKIKWSDFDEETEYVKFEN